MTTGERIKRARKKLGMTQKKLALAAGLSEIAIRKYEADKRNPGREALKLLADKLGVSEPYLLGYADEDNDYVSVDDEEAFQEDDARKLAFARRLFKDARLIIDRNENQEVDEYLIIFPGCEMIAEIMTKQQIFDFVDDIVQKAEQQVKRYITRKIEAEFAHVIDEDMSKTVYANLTPGEKDDYYPAPLPEEKPGEE